MALRDQQKMFLQILMNHRSMGEEELKQFYKKLFGEDRSLENMADDIEEMNEAIHSLHHKIEKVRCEMTGRPFYIYYSKHDKNFGSIDKLFTPAEKNLIAHLIQEIVDSETGILDYDSVQRLSFKVLMNNGKQLDTVELVKKLLDNHLLARTDDELLHLSALGLKELEPYLRATFDDIQECHLCNSIIVHGVTCQSCTDCKLHKHCLKDYTKNRRAQYAMCPKCDKEF
ncbi:hypothetical protein LSTR_LSTR006044 [Laodelphax striatellus]|uniref:Non-structural maintenance of chromosomes element 1 homolog n=1 Tax=Laodelphax striatellus TaxID=195883 RepID=A0A482XQL5_LAOST|nr:hypothetical protein LSTR_LSTR006044 [Laodelphax striatellus]